LNHDGTGSTTVDSAGAVAEQPSVSADGTKIAFASISVVASIKIINSNGSGYLNLVDTSDDNTQPTISPDGQFVVYVSTQSGTPQLFRVPSSGGSPVQLTSLANGATWPQYSPDGTKIAFVSGATNDDIYLMNADGSGIIQLTNSSADECKPAFSPNGQSVVYMKNYGDPFDPNGQIMKIAIGTGTITRLTTSMSFDDEPCYSSDGNYIYFTREVNFAREVMRMSAFGGTEIQLTSDAAWASAPRSPGQ
jgi:TolB protein